jgi:hypothetical protein
MSHEGLFSRSRRREESVSSGTGRTWRSEGNSESSWDSQNPLDRRPAVSTQRKIEIIVVVVGLVFLFGFLATVFLSFLLGIG